MDLRGKHAGRSKKDPEKREVNLVFYYIGD